MAAAAPSRPEQHSVAGGLHQPPSTDHCGGEFTEEAVDHLGGGIVAMGVVSAVKVVRSRKTMVRPGFDATGENMSRRRPGRNPAR